MFWHASRESNRGIRLWWHFKGKRHRVFRVEFYWWSRHCHASVDVDNDGWGWAFAFPPLALYVSFDGFPGWYPQRKCIATWDNNREFWLVDERECRVSIHDWTLRVTPWGRLMEWRTADPWWVRGISLNIPNLLFGRTRYTSEGLALVPCEVPMPEGTYAAVAKIERQTWKRPLWFSRTRTSAWLDIPKGIPHAGKGENSWDCGDDGLFGIGGDTIDDAIRRAQESVAESRRRYGKASDAAIREALA